MQSKDLAQKLMLSVAWDQDPAAVRKLLEDGLDVNVTYEGMTALMAAALVPDYEMARLLLEAGADVNLTSTDLATPLHRAAFQGGRNLCVYFWRLAQIRTHVATSA